MQHVENRIVARTPAGLLESSPFAEERSHRQGLRSEVVRGIDSGLIMLCLGLSMFSITSALPGALRAVLMVGLGTLFARVAGAGIAGRGVRRRFMRFGGLAGQLATPFAPQSKRAIWSLPSVQLESVLQSLADTAEQRDSQTHGHCERVALDSVALGTALGLPWEQLGTLYWAALLHDVGKIAIAETVLSKAGRLTADELGEIRRHPAYGADLLTGISTSLARVAESIRAHHERWDGLGYPRGLRSECIPLVARIVSVVDVYEALTSPRPYREPLSPEQAVVYIRRGSGTQFDPDVVDIFERLHGRRALPSQDLMSAPAAVAEDRIRRALELSSL